MVGEQQPDRELTPDNWQLSLYGIEPGPRVLGFDELLQLPQTRREWDIHCVTRWSRQGDQFTGVLFKDLIQALAINVTTGFVRFVAYSSRNHDTSLPLTVCFNEDVLLAYQINGQPLAKQHGYPVRVFAPSRYFYKSLKWLKEIHFMAEDQLGFWERGGYHNQANYQTEQRYITGNLTEKELAQLRRTLNFQKYQGQILLSLDLSGLDLTGANLQAVQLKNCNLQNCQLAGVNLTAANLSNSSLIGSNLAGANLTGADLDGVLFMGCDLTNAKLDQTLLNATEFVRPGFTPANLAGASVVGAETGGLVEQQQTFLRSQAVVF